MNAVVFEHVPIDELPSAWRDKLVPSAETHVTVRIEQELAASAVPLDDAGFVSNDPAFGIWRDREDVADVQAYLRELRAPRYASDGSRTKP